MTAELPIQSSSGIPEPDPFRGEKCGPCFREGRRDVDATHKVGEEIPASASTSDVMAHNLTQNVCCMHFEWLMGRHSGFCALLQRKRMRGEKA